MPAHGDVLTLPARLREHGARTPEDPWLFFAEGLDWRWLSWSQVADRVARAAAGLADLPRPSRLAVDDRFHPDSVTAILAVQAAGHVALTHAAPAAADLPRIVLPEVRSRLSRWTPAPLPDLAAPDDDAFQTAGGEGVSHRRLAAAADRWAALLDAPSSPRPIVLASAALAAPLRPILLAWVLASGAAWILEDDPDLFLSTALGLRPTVVLATGAELARLAAALEPQRHRRWQRFTAVAATDGDAAGMLWDELGVRVARLAAQDFAATRRTR